MKKTKHISVTKSTGVPQKKIERKPSVSPAIYKSAGGNSIDVSYSKASEINDCFKKLGGELKVSIDKRFKSKFPLKKMWDCVQFRMVNPTSIPCAFNLFDGYSIVPVPNTPSGYVPILNPLGVPVMNFPASAGSSYPSFECATVAASLPPPVSLTDPLAVSYVPSTDRIYVTAFDGVAGCTQLIINPNTNLIVNSFLIPLGLTSWMSVYASVSNKVYVIDKTVSIAPIDCATETALAAITLPAAAEQIAYSASNNYLYVTVPSLDRLYYIDCATDTIVGFISLVGGGSSVNALVTWSVGISNYALVLNPTNTTAFYINTTTNTIISTFSTSDTADGFGAICYNSVKDTVYYLDSTSIIREIDMSTLTMLPTAISGLGGSYQLLFISTYNVIYTAKRIIFSNTEVHVINCVTNVVDLIIPTSITFPTVGSRLAYDNANNSVWVTGDISNTTISKLCGTNPMCYIVGSEDYNEFCQDLRNNPICVRQFQIFAQNSEQVANPLNLQTKDANGTLCTIPKLPNVTLSVDQFQPNIATVDFHCKDLVLDCLTTINQYTIQPNSEVNVVMYYKQVRRVDILSSTQTVCKRVIETKCPDGDSRSEAQLQFQSPRPHNRPKWLKPFNPNMIKDGSGGTSSDSCNTCFEELGHPIITSKKVKVIEVDASDLVTVKRLDKADICGECIDNIGHPLMTDKKVTNIDVDINELKTVKRLDKADVCGECIENIGHPIMKKLSKYADESIGNLDILKVDLKMEQFTYRARLKK